MNVVFVHPGGPSMASYRYRSEIPSEALKTFWGIDACINEGEADIVVFSKPDAAGLATAKNAKREGAKIVADFCDDHFEHPTLGPVYHEFRELADCVVCPSEAMQLRSGGEIIPDPYEFERCDPHADGDELIWFGHQRNLDEILSTKIERIRIVTGPTNRVQNYIPWSVENLKDTLEISNIAMLPTLKGGEYKSANRIINAVMAGCFVVAGDKPSYREFRDMLWVGPWFGGLQWARAFRDELNDHVAQAQSYIESKYSPAVVGKKWADLLCSL